MSGIVSSASKMAIPFNRQIHRAPDDQLPSFAALVVYSHQAFVERVASAAVTMSIAVPSVATVASPSSWELISHALDHHAPTAVPAHIGCPSRLDPIAVRNEHTIATVDLAKLAFRLMCRPSSATERRRLLRQTGF